MRVHKCDIWEKSRIVWNWEWVKDFPSCMCKELLRHDGEYFVGLAEIDSVDEYLALQLRDQSKSKCLTPNDQSRQMRHILDRMTDQDWTFEKLAGGSLSTVDVEREPVWFEKCKYLDENFDLDIMGPLAVHPRIGSKNNVKQGDVYDPSVHEIYEGQHRALVLAKKLVKQELNLRPLKMIYLWPDRPTS
jgi:hypothetical protein